MAAHLSRGRLNLGFLRELARKELLESLDKCHGTKALVWDDQLIGPCSLFAEYALLKDHDVTKMFTIHSGRLPQADVQHIIFLTRAQVPLMEIIAENIIKEESNSSSKDFRHKEFHIFFVPRKNFLCDKKLKSLGVYGSFANLEDINVELYPYDSDLMTMELDCAYRECHLDGDMTSMYHVAKSLMTLQSLYGLIPHVYGQGKCAKHVYDLMVRMRRELAGNEPQITSQIDALLLIDREVDLLSPLVTQLTYEGLIDEIFGINNTIVKLPPEKFIKATDGGPQEIPTEQKIVLNSSEDLYTELRKCNFNAVGPTLSKKAKLISAQFEERHGAKTVGEIKQFVAKLPQMQAAKQSLANHTAIAELIKEVATSDDFLETVQIEHDFLNTLDTDKPNAYLEECIVKQDPLLKVLRMICIQSFTNSGLKSKVLDYYKKEILQTYGYHHLLTLQNLEKVGLLRVQEQRTYQVLRKTLRLTEEAVDEQDPKDVTYVHSGYAPIGVRLAQHLARSGSWRNIQDALRLLPGPNIEEVQQVPLGLRKRRGSGSSIQSSTEDQKVTLVFFLGGCTYAEIAALRFLSIQEDYPTEYVIATTKIINGKTFLDSLMEKLQPDCTTHQPV